MYVLYIVAYVPLIKAEQLSVLGPEMDPHFYYTFILIR